VIGYAGFIGIATWHKSSDENHNRLANAWEPKSEVRAPLN
jgi:hypothetical protein